MSVVPSGVSGVFSVKCPTKSSVVLSLYVEFTLLDGRRYIDLYNYCYHHRYKVYTDIKHANRIKPIKHVV